MKSLIVSSFFSVLMLFANSALAHDEGATPSGHLKFAKGKLHAHLYWESGPNDGKPSVLRVEFKDGLNHQPQPIESKLSVKPWMPDMGHGSAQTTVAPVTDDKKSSPPGVYRVSNIVFVMPGTWELQFTLTEPNGKKETEKWSVEVKPDAGQSNVSTDHTGDEH